MLRSVSQQYYTDNRTDRSGPVNEFSDRYPAELANVVRVSVESSVRSPLFAQQRDPSHS